MNVQVSHSRSKILNNVAFFWLHMRLESKRQMHTTKIVCDERGASILHTSPSAEQGMTVDVSRELLVKRMFKNKCICGGRLIESTIELNMWQSWWRSRVISSQ